MPIFCSGVLPSPKVSVLRRRGLAFIRSSVLQLKLHCPEITIEDVRKSDLLAELTDVLSDGVSQDLWLLSLGIDNNPWGQYRPLTPTFYKSVVNRIRFEVKHFGIIVLINRTNFLIPFLGVKKTPPSVIFDLHNNFFKF